MPYWSFIRTPTRTDHPSRCRAEFTTALQEAKPALDEMLQIGDIIFSGALAAVKSCRLIWTQVSRCLGPETAPGTPAKVKICCSSPLVGLLQLLISEARFCRKLNQARGVNGFLLSAES